MRLVHNRIIYYKYNNPEFVGSSPAQVMSLHSLFVFTVIIQKLHCQGQ